MQSMCSCLAFEFKLLFKMQSFKGSGRRLKFLTSDEVPTAGGCDPSGNHIKRGIREEGGGGRGACSSKPAHRLAFPCS